MCRLAMRMRNENPGPLARLYIRLARLVTGRISTAQTTASKQTFQTRINDNADSFSSPRGPSLAGGLWVVVGR